MAEIPEFPPVRTDATTPYRRAAFWFVALVWLASSLALWNFAARRVSVLPFTDDIAMALTLAAPEPFSAELLWAPNNEHRLPVPKLVYIALLSTTHDFRTGAWLQAGVLSVASLALLAALRRRRGHLEFTDAVIPLLLHDLGNTENLLNSFQLAFSVPMFLVCALVTLALAWKKPPSWRGYACLWLLLVLLVGCGGVGFPYALACVAWPLHGGWRAWRERGSGWRATLSVTLAGVVLLTAAIVGYVSAIVMLPGFAPPSLTRFLAVSAQFLASGIGVTGAIWWPWSIAVLVVLAIALVHLSRAFRAPDERELALPLLCLLAGGVALALLVAWGRGSDSEFAGLTNRYVLLAAVTLTIAHLSLRVTAGGAFARNVRWVAFATVVASVAPNVDYAAVTARQRARVTRDFLERSRAGAGIDELARETYMSFFYSAESFAEHLHAFQRSGYLEFLLPGERLGSAEDPLGSLEPKPARVTAVEGPDVRLLEGRPALVTRGLTRVEYDVPSGMRSVRVLAAAAGDASATSVPFTAEWRASDGYVETLAVLTLTRASRPPNAAWEVLELALPAPRSAQASATLALRFEPPTENTTDGWNFLRDVEFGSGP